MRFIYEVAAFSLLAIVSVLVMEYIWTVDDGGDE